MPAPYLSYSVSQLPQPTDYTHNLSSCLNPSSFYQSIVINHSHNVPQFQDQIITDISNDTTTSTIMLPPIRKALSDSHLISTSESVNTTIIRSIPSKHHIQKSNFIITKFVQTQHCAHTGKFDLEAKNKTETDNSRATESETKKAREKQHSADKNNNNTNNHSPPSRSSFAANVYLGLHHPNYINKYNNESPEQMNHDATLINDPSYSYAYSNSFIQARNNLLSYLASPHCTLFSNSTHIIAVTDKQLDQILIPNILWRWKKNKKYNHNYQFSNNTDINNNNNNRKYCNGDYRAIISDKGASIILILAKWEAEKRKFELFEELMDELILIQKLTLLENQKKASERKRVDLLENRQKRVNQNQNNLNKNKHLISRGK